MPRIPIVIEVKVLSFAAVGDHGREWWTRFASSALAFAALGAPLAAQSSADFIDLAPDFASKITAALSASSSVHLSFPPDDARMQAEVARLLAARGVRIADSPDATPVSAACHSNLRERVCAAGIGAGVPRVVITTGARAGAATPEARDPLAAVELMPLYTQRTMLLDVVEAGDQLLVLTPDAVSLVADAGTAGGGGRVVASQTIQTARVWPRDVRGMLHVSGAAFEAFLPGVTCRGAVAPFALRCADESEPWPIGLDNSGVAPSRNTFSTPEGMTFYEAASIANGRWMVVGEQGVLTLLDPQRRAIGRLDQSDHVARLADNCGGDASYVVTTARGTDPSRETIHLARLTGDRLAVNPSSAPLIGVMTSLWGAPGRRAATAIVYDASAGRYEAFRVSLSCAR